MNDRSYETPFIKKERMNSDDIFETLIRGITYIYTHKLDDAWNGVYLLKKTRDIKSLIASSNNGAGNKTGE